MDGRVIESQHKFQVSEWISIVFTGYNITDYGDMLFEEIPNDTPMFNIKHPRTTGLAMQQVFELSAL